MKPLIDIAFICMVAMTVTACLWIGGRIVGAAFGRSLWEQLGKKEGGE